MRMLQYWRSYQRPACEKLFRAIADNQADDVRRLLLDQCLEPRAPMVWYMSCRDVATQRTPLHAAAVHGRLAAARLMLSHVRSAPPEAAMMALNSRDDNEATPAYLAAWGGRVLLLRELLMAGAHLDLSTRQGRTPLHAACERNWQGAVQQLTLGCGEGGTASLNATDVWLATPMHVAAHWGSLESLKILLESKRTDIKHVNRRNYLGWAPIHGAARRGHESVVILLASKNVAANVDLQDNNGWTPLHHAADSGHEKTVAALLKAGALVDVRESVEGVTPLHFAAHRGHLNVVLLLLENGACQAEVANDGWTPLHVACRLRRASVVKLLLSKPGAPVSARGRRNWTPLHVAAWIGDVGIVQQLLDNGAERNAALTDSWTPIHLATMCGRTEVLRSLLKAGADPLKRDKRLGWKLVDTAIFFQHTDCALLLNRSALAARPDPVRGQSALLSAAEQRAVDESFVEIHNRGRRSIDGIHLHKAMVAAGFTQSRAALQSAAADHLQELITDYSNGNGTRLERDWFRLCGSFAEGWGSSVTRLNGCVDEDSDIDMSEYFSGRSYHLEGRCRCSPTQSSEEDADAAAEEKELLQLTTLKYSQGHVEVRGTAANPARTQYGTLGRPAMDMAVMYHCCRYPHIQALKSPGYLPPELVLRMKKEVARPNSCPLVGAALPGREGKQLRVSTKWLELPFVRSFTDVQGQAYIILKYLVKRVINSKHGGRLKSFHAKTLAFHMVREMPPNKWSPERLPELTEAALEKLERELDGPVSQVGMRSFFFEDTPLYLKSSVDKTISNDTTLDAVRIVMSDIGEVLSEFADQLEPLRPNKGLDYHPFMLLPRSKQLRQQARRHMESDYRSADQSDGPAIEYHQLHEFVRQRLRDLSPGGVGGRGLDALLKDIARLPDFAHTTRECLAALANLRFGHYDVAVKRLADLLESGHQPIRGLPLPAPDVAVDSSYVRRCLLSADSAWRFCFVQQAQQRPLRFDFLSLSFPRRLLRFDDYYAVNFDALAKSLYLHLLQSLRKGSRVSNSTTRRWFSDMLDAEMDASEVELMVNSCRHEDLLLRLIREHKDTLSRSRTVHCLLAERIKKSESLQRKLKHSFLEDVAARKNCV